MKTYAGIDLHSNNAFIVVIDDGEKVLFSRRIANDLEMFLNIFQEYKETLVGAVVESTYNWYWLADAMTEAGYKIHLAMPAKIKQYTGIKHTNDKSDAHWLARLLKLNLIDGGYIMPPAMRSQRELARQRMQMVRQQTQTVLRLQSMLTRYYSIKFSAEKLKKLKAEDFATICKDDNISQCATVLHTALHAQIVAINSLEKNILKQIRRDESFKRLKAVPGIGDILALVILLETGEMKRFKEPGKYVSYCRLVNSERISNNKKKGENNSKNGNPYLCWAFIEAANFAIRYSEPVGKFYQRKLKRCIPVQAKVAVAHKLSRAVYYVLKNEVPFDLKKAFG